MTVESSFASSESLNEPLGVHLARAKETGRGREARSPAEIPWRGWLDIIWRTARQASEDRILAIAGGVVFYGLLALFPAITALVSFYGLFATPDSIGSHLSFLQGVMPAEAYSVVQDQVGRVIAKGQAGLTFGFLVGLILALWSANAGVKAVMDALNIVYEEDEKRGFIKLNLVSRRDPLSEDWLSAVRQFGRDRADRPRETTGRPSVRETRGSPRPRPRCRSF
jgi:membrane protein